MKQSQRIVKNILAGGVAVGIGGVIQLAAVVLIARTVGVTQFGVYSFILAFAMFFQLLADSGLSNILVRELAVEPQKMPQTLGAALSLIWLLTIVAAGLILIVVPFLSFPPHVKVLAICMGAATLSQFHATAYGSVLRSQEDNELHALGFILHKLAFFLLVLIGLKAGYALPAVVLAHLIPNLMLWAFYRWIVVRNYTHPGMLIDVTTWRYLLKHSLPVGGATMLRLLSQQIDVMILTMLTDLKTVGLFSGPYRISMALRFIPQTMAIPLYPMYSRLARDPKQREHLRAAYIRSVKFFLVIGLPIAVAFISLSKELVTLLLGSKYLGATPAMQILGLAFIPFFVTNPLPFLLTALDEQRFLLVSTVVSFALRIVLNVALTRAWGFLGPCVAFFASEVVMLVIVSAKLSRCGLKLDFIHTMWKPMLAAAAMAVALRLAQDAPPIWLIPIATFASLAYFALVLKLGTFSSTDLALAREGLGFLGPLIAKWTNQPQHKVA